VHPATFSLGSGFLKGSILAVHVLVDQEGQPTGTSLGSYLGAQVEAAPSYYRQAFNAMGAGASLEQSNARYLQTYIVRAATKGSLFKTSIARLTNEVVFRTWMEENVI
jgi:hypothetical protein